MFLSHKYFIHFLDTSHGFISKNIQLLLQFLPAFFKTGFVCIFGDKKRLGTQQDKSALRSLSYMKRTLLCEKFSFKMPVMESSTCQFRGTVLVRVIVLVEFVPILFGIEVAVKIFEQGRKLKRKSDGYHKT